MSFRPRIIPCLLLQNQGLVKTLCFKDPVYVGDPLNTVKIFNDLAADELIILDILAGLHRPIQFDLIKKIAEEAYMPFSYGGGIACKEDAVKIIQNGAEKVIINSAFFQNPDLVQTVSDQFGSQAVAVCLDYKVENSTRKVFAHKGKKDTGLILEKAVELAVNNGAGELILSNINHDGMMIGYDEGTIDDISQICPVPIIALGGGRNMEDFRSVTLSGASAAAAGSTFVFLGGRKSVLINYPEKEKFHGFFGS